MVTDETKNMSSWVSLGQEKKNLKRKIKNVQAHHHAQREQNLHQRLDGTEWQISVFITQKWLAEGTGRGNMAFLGGCRIRM